MAPTAEHQSPAADGPEAEFCTGLAGSLQVVHPSMQSCQLGSWSPIGV